MNENLNILIVDNKEANRNLISGIVSDIPGAAVMDTASNGRITLAKLRRFPVDMILLDLEIPEMQGLETMRKIREAHHHVEVVILSRMLEGWVDDIVGALELGAIDFVPKPVDTNENSIREFRLRLLTIVGLLHSRRNFRSIGNRVTGPGETRPDGMSDRKPSSPLLPGELRPSVLPPRIEVVAIAVSTGGPNALAKVIPRLPRNLGVPVLIVQHMPPSFTASLAGSLNAKSSVRVQEAVDGEDVLPNTAYIAPGGRHMLIQAERGRDNLVVRRCIRLTDDPPENSVRPSADVLFRSLPAVYDGNILPVIMTGMGCDGMKGVLVMKQRGCYCLSQTTDSCTVYGMPRSVDEAALSDEKVPLERLATRIVGIVQGK